VSLGIRMLKSSFSGLKVSQFAQAAGAGAGAGVAGASVLAGAVLGFFADREVCPCAYEDKKIAVSRSASVQSERRKYIVINLPILLCWMYIGLRFSDSSRDVDECQEIRRKCPPNFSLSFFINMWGMN
jgi:hypothetical protein